VALPLGELVPALRAADRLAGLFRPRLGVVQVRVEFGEVLGQLLPPEVSIVQVPLQTQAAKTLLLSCYDPPGPSRCISGVIVAVSASVRGD
jgi:hypothetical protein